jgi:two-component system phosphate regulon sensor histidine kinase PhoR
MIAGWLILGICTAVAVLAWFGYTASREWRHSSELLMHRRAEEMADLLVRALARDMRGVQDQVLQGLQREQISLLEPYEIMDLVATAFARYPYPECFFAWTDSATPADGVFFTRADRTPTWLPRQPSQSPFPVAMVRNAAASSKVVDRVTAAAAQGREFAVYETELGGERYQVVARLLYRSSRRQHLERVFGFVVNLNWARNAYFDDLTREVHHISGTYDGLSVVVQDEAGSVVAGNTIPASAGHTAARLMQPLFFDPALVAVDPPNDLPIRPWTVRVNADGEPAHASALRGADRTLFVTTTAAIAFGLGLLLAGRALRASANLAQLRADFVASVTHELKTPLSTISAMGETLARGRLPEGAAVREYAQIVAQEAKRLSRLVDNLLAYSRVTDVGEIYSFEPLAVVDIVDDIVRRFQPQFLHHGIEVQIDIPPDLPPVAGDRTALELVFDNVVDNALRYSGDSRWIGISAERSAEHVRIAVRDKGPGIPTDELNRVESRFVRGRRVGQAGSGLGLAIASRIVRDHGGTFRIESSLGRGTTVFLCVPLSEV